MGFYVSVWSFFSENSVPTQWVSIQLCRGDSSQRQLCITFSFDRKNFIRLCLYVVLYFILFPFVHFLLDIVFELSEERGELKQLTLGLCYLFNFIFLYVEFCRCRCQEAVWSYWPILLLTFQWTEILQWYYPLKEITLVDILCFRGSDRTL